MPLGGGATTTLAAVDTILALALDATHVYWLTAAPELAYPKFEIASVPLGGGPGKTLLSTRGNLADIAVAASDLFAVSGDAYPYTDATLEMSIAGGAPSTLSVGVTWGVALDAMYAYFVVATDLSTRPQDAIVKVPFAGGAPRTLAADRPVANKIAVDDQSVFWSEQGAIMRLTPK
jgi:hypothetical protein